MVLIFQPQKEHPFTLPEMVLLLRSRKADVDLAIMSLSIIAMAMNHYMPT